MTKEYVKYIPGVDVRSVSLCLWSGDGDGDGDGDWDEVEDEDEESEGILPSSLPKSSSSVSLSVSLSLTLGWPFFFRLRTCYALAYWSTSASSSQDGFQMSGVRPSFCHFFQWSSSWNTSSTRIFDGSAHWNPDGKHSSLIHADGLLESLFHGIVAFFFLDMNPNSYVLHRIA